MTKEQLPEGSYFTIGRQVGLGVVVAFIAAVVSVYLGIQMELSDHKSRLDMLERMSRAAVNDHDALTRVLVIQENMQLQLKRIEGYLMDRPAAGPATPTR